MNYDKFNWDFTPPTGVMPDYVEEPEEDRVTTSLFDNDCVGAKCCSDGMIYDTVSRTCIPKEKKSQGKPNSCNANMSVSLYIHTHVATDPRK